MPKINAVTDKPIAEPAAKRTTKVALVHSMLERKAGATIAELGSATGWQAHTVRASLTGLRKKDANIGKRDRDGVTCYFIASAA